MIGIKDQCFGVEIELTGITRAEAAEALAAYFETTPQRSYDNYDSWYVPDREGKQWRIMSDGSIRAEWNDILFIIISSAFVVNSITPKIITIPIIDKSTFLFTLLFLPFSTKPKKNSNSIVTHTPTIADELPHKNESIRINNLKYKFLNKTSPKIINGAIIAE